MADLKTRLLRVDDVAELLDCTPRMVRKLTSERRIPFVKVGALTRFRATDVEAFVSSRLVKAVADAS